VISVEMPRFAKEMETGEIRWLCRVGDVVSAHDVIAEVAEKVTFELEAPVAGRIAALLITDGAEAPVGAELAQIED